MARINNQFNQKYLHLDILSALGHMKNKGKDLDEQNFLNQMIVFTALYTTVIKRTWIKKVDSLTNLAEDTNISLYSSC